MGINYNLAVDGWEGLNLYFYVFLSATSGSAAGVRVPRVSPQQSRARCCPGHHRAGTGDVTAQPWHPSVALAWASVAAALLEIPALPAPRLAAAAVISIAMAMPARLPSPGRRGPTPGQSPAPTTAHPTERPGHRQRGYHNPKPLWGCRGTCPLTREARSGWEAGGEGESVPGTPPSPVPSTTAGPLCPTAPLGSAPLCCYQPVAPNATWISTGCTDIKVFPSSCWRLTNPPACLFMPFLALPPGPS